MEALKVVCINIPPKHYPNEYVIKLKNMCLRHLPKHEFICITDRPMGGVNCWEPVCEYEGWWGKIGLFKPGLFNGPVMYLDLDVIITGSIKAMVEHIIFNARFGVHRPLYARDDFSYSMKNPRTDLSADMIKTLGGAGCINSSVMLWHGNRCRKIWDEYSPEAAQGLHGDQNWISKVMGLENITLLSERVVKSYKYHWLRGEGHGDICVFHGEPKPHQVEDSWVADNWH